MTFTTVLHTFCISHEDCWFDADETLFCLKSLVSCSTFAFPFLLIIYFLFAKAWRSCHCILRLFQKSFVRARIFYLTLIGFIELRLWISIRLMCKTFFFTVLALSSSHQVIFLNHHIFFLDLHFVLLNIHFFVSSKHTIFPVIFSS